MNRFGFKRPQAIRPLPPEPPPMKAQIGHDYVSVYVAFGTGLAVQLSPVDAEIMAEGLMHAAAKVRATKPPG